MKEIENFDPEYFKRPKETIVESTVRRLIVAIRKGKYKMGEKLPSEFELMQKLEVSRNSLREAMKILSAMGIVEIKRGDGTYLCDQIRPSIFDSVINSMILEASTNEQVIELRSTLDSLILRLAIEKCTTDDINKLKDYIRLMRVAFDEGNISKAAKYDYNFHLYLIQCCKNPFLARICESTYILFEDSIENNIRTEKLFAKADEHHRQIVDCLVNKSLEDVDSVVENSLSSWKRNMK